MEEAELRVEQRPELKSPVLICSFRGWNDGGQGASLATSFLARTWQTEKFAEIDPELFFDFQSTRPHVSLVDGTVRRIDWPENSFQYARLTHGSRDVVLLLGTEPSLRWKDLHRARARARDRSRRLDGRHARLAARRRAAHPAGAGHRERDRPGARRGARPAGVPLRRPDGGRRRAPRRLPRGRDPVGLALGRGAALRVAHPVAARRQGAVRSACRSCSTCRSTPASSVRRATRTCSR